jgi:hypothetical protein
MKKLVVIFFLSSSFLFLNSSAASEPSLEQLLVYLRFIAVKPNDYKFDMAYANYNACAKKLYRNAQSQPVIEFLRESFEDLVFDDKMIGSCDLLVVAYASGDLHLKQRALELVFQAIDGKNEAYNRSQHGKGQKSVSDRFNYFFGLLFNSSFHSLAVGNKDQVLVDFLSNLTKYRDLFLQQAQLYFQNHPDEIKKSIIFSLVRNAYGENFVEPYLEKNRKERFQNDLIAVRRLLESSGPENSSIDGSYFLDHATDPDVKEVLRSVLRHTSLFEDYLVPKFVLAAYSSDDTVLKKMALSLVKTKIESKPMMPRDFGDNRCTFGSDICGFVDYDLLKQIWASQRGEDPVLQNYLVFVNQVSNIPNFSEPLIKMFAVIAKEDLDFQKKIGSILYSSPFVGNLKNVSKSILDSACGLGCSTNWIKNFRDEDVSRALAAFKSSNHSDFNKAFAVFLNNSDHPKIIKYFRKNFFKLSKSWSPGDFEKYRLTTALILYFQSDAVNKTKIVNQLKKENLLNSNNVFNQVFSYLYRILDSSKKVYETLHFISQIGWDYEKDRNTVENGIYLSYPNSIQGPINVLSELIIAQYKGRPYYEQLRNEKIKQLRNAMDGVPQEPQNSHEYKFAQLISFLGKENLNLAESFEMQKLMKDLVSMSYRPTAQELFRQWLDGEKFKNERGLYGDFYLGAYGSGDSQLKERVVSDVENKINGLDSEFNATVGKNLKSIEQRYFYFVSLLLKSAGEANFIQNVWMRDSLYPLVLDLLKNLKIDPLVISSSLAKFLNQKAESKYKTLAKNLLGEEYVKKIVKVEVHKKRNQQYVYVNGGFSETSNIVTHESDLKGFIYNLFPYYTAVLSGGGLGGPVSERLNGKLYEVTVAQFLPQTSDLNLDKPFFAATLKNYENLFQDLSQQKPDSLTVVYGGHGNTNGFALWGGNDFLSARDILKAYSNFPENTVIQSLFLQCYGGNTVVSSKRSLPKSAKAIETYFSHYFPKNRCSMAMSSHEEIGQYYTNGKKWDHNYWSEMLEGQPWSLDRIQAEAFDDPNIRTTPVQTSDYMMDDLTSLICGDHHPWSDDSWPECDSLKSHPFHAVSKEVTDTVSRVLDPIDANIVQWTNQLTETEFYDLRLVKKGEKDLDSVFENYLKYRKNPGYTDEDFYTAVKILASPNLYFTTGMMVLGKVERFKNFYNDKFIEFIKNRETEFEAFNLNQIKSDMTYNIGIDLLRSNVLESIYLIQVEKKKQAKKYRALQRTALETYMATHSYFSKIKDLYESIRKCETALIE